MACRRQAIIWTNAGILIWPLGTNYSEMLIEIDKFSFKKIHLKTLFAKYQPSCLSLNVLTGVIYHVTTKDIMKSPTVDTFFTY